MRAVVVFDVKLRVNRDCFTGPAHVEDNEGSCHVFYERYKDDKVRGSTFGDARSVKGSSAPPWGSLQAPCVIVLCHPVIGLKLGHQVVSVVATTHSRCGGSGRVWPVPCFFRVCVRVLCFAFDPLLRFGVVAHGCLLFKRLHYDVRRFKLPNAGVGFEYVLIYGVPRRGRVTFIIVTI